MRIALAIVLACASVAQAGDLTKEECLDAHSKGQDAKEAGKISLARKLFLTCAQSGCPNLVQGDCARFADDLGRLQPTISFAARDSAGADLPDTTVYVDGVLVVTRIDGEPHDVDPGNHTFKFTNAGRDQVVTVVVGSGEKGRTVVGTFPAPEAPKVILPTTLSKAPPPRPTSHTTHAPAAKYLIAGGGLAALGGAALSFYGYSKIPANCTLSTHECAAPPGDPSFGKAKSAVKDVDYGMVLGGVGLAALAGGLIWYATSGHEEHDTSLVVGPNSVGLKTSF
ncbi:MAG: hypothetical protein JO257_00125 [Deltaproteobacteria bacterium]|nr:hypothetical protein [Deltaproteobacteria bacterium]